MRNTITLSIAALLASSQLFAQTELKTKSISVFKNGKSFVVKEGSVATTDKVYTLNKLPNALFGTFWFNGLKSDIAQVISKLEVVDEPVERKANGFLELLYANKGKQITLNTTDDKTYTGIVEDFDLPEEVNSYLQLKEAELSEKYGSMYTTDFRLFPNSSPVLLLKMNNKWVSINPLSIKTIEFAEKPESITKSKVKVKKPLIKVHFAQGGQQDLNMMYLQDGISWTPTYLLELVSDTEARLKLQAEVVNNVEDIKNTDINFVVGIPNFKFANSPATLTSFVQKAMSNIRDYDFSNLRFSNAIASQAISESRYDADEESVIIPDVDAEASEDLYFYNIKNVDLEKGGRAHYPLLNATIKVKHLYECNLPSSLDERNFQVDENYSFDPKYSNVFHSIEIKNDTKSPFTTGPVMIVQGETQKPLAEDMIKYTGKGMTSSIQLTQAPDIRVEEKEKIISTQSDAKKKNGYTYDLVTVQSEISVVNSKGKEIELAISKAILGKVQTATIKYDSRQRVNKNNINPVDNLKFTLNMKAGESNKFTYTYQVYIRS